MKNIILALVIMMLSACTPVDKTKSSEIFEKLCKDEPEIKITWHSSNGHFSLTCTLPHEKIKEFNENE